MVTAKSLELETCCSCRPNQAMSRWSKQHHPNSESWVASPRLREKPGVNLCLCRRLLLVWNSKEAFCYERPTLEGAAAART